MRLYLSVVTLALLAAGCKARQYSGVEGLEAQSDAESQKNAALARLENCEFLKDVYEPRVKFPIGTPKAGLCIDTRLARNLFLQTPEAARKFGAFSPAQQSQPMIYVANVSHMGNFYLAAIPDAENDVEKIIFHEESFPAPIPAAHGQIRLDFKRDVLLVPQIPGNGEPLSTKYLILSFEALGEPGWKFDIAKGLQGQFAGVWRIKTLQDFAVDISKQSPKHEVKQYLLAFENHPKQRAQILREWIKRSTENKLQHMYDTVKSSCAMEALEAIEHVRGDVTACDLPDQEQLNFLQRIKSNLLIAIDKRVATPMDIYPTFAEKALKMRSLLKENLPNLDADPIYSQLVK
jgi:hypothetical protein